MFTTLEPGENGDMMLNIPPELIEQGLFLEGDLVDIKAKPGCLTIENRSCKQMRVSRFRRNLNSIMRNLSNEHHPLNRVIVNAWPHSFWVIPHDQTKQHAFFQNSKYKPNLNEADTMDKHVET